MDSNLALQMEHFLKCCRCIPHIHLVKSPWKTFKRGSKMWLVIGQSSQADQSDLLLVLGKPKLYASCWCEGQHCRSQQGVKREHNVHQENLQYHFLFHLLMWKYHPAPSTTYFVVFPNSLKLLLHMLLCSASVSIKKADWFWNSWKTKTSWKHFQLELGMTDELDFGDTIWMIQLPFKVNQNLEKTKSKQLNHREI